MNYNVHKLLGPDSLPACVHQLFAVCLELCADESIPEWNLEQQLRTGMCGYHWLKEE